MSFLARFWPYIVIALALAFLWGMHIHDQRRYAALQTDYANYRAQVADANAKAQKAAREAVEAQIAERSRIDKHNAEVLADYAQTNAAITADRDRSRELVRRLLAANQGRAASPSGSMPEAGHQSGAAEAGSPGGHGDLGELLVDTASECRANAAQLNALIAQISRQL